MGTSQAHSPQKFCEAPQAISSLPPSLPLCSYLGPPNTSWSWTAGAGPAFSHLAPPLSSWGGWSTRDLPLSPRNPQPLRQGLTPHLNHQVPKKSPPSEMQGNFFFQISLLMKVLPMCHSPPIAPHLPPRGNVFLFVPSNRIPSPTKSCSPSSPPSNAPDQSHHTCLGWPATSSCPLASYQHE